MITFRQLLIFGTRKQYFFEISRVKISSTYHSKVSAKFRQCFTISCRQACKLFREIVLIGMNTTVVLSKQTTWSHAKAHYPLAETTNTHKHRILPRIWVFWWIALVCKQLSRMWHDWPSNYPLVPKLRSDSPHTPCFRFLSTRLSSDPQCKGVTTLYVKLNLNRWRSLHATA